MVCFSAPFEMFFHIGLVNMIKCLFVFSVVEPPLISWINAIWLQRLVL